MKLLKDSKGTAYQLFATFITNLMAIPEGMATAWTAPMIPYFLSEKSHIKMTENEAEWLETSFILGSLVGVPITAAMVHNIGPKKSLIVAIFSIGLSWIVVAVSPVVGYIYAVRAIMGAALNTAYISAPMYVGEIAHKKIRGFLSSNVYLMSLLGQMVMYCIGPFVPYIVPSIVSVIILVIQIAIFITMPESPYFLVSKNRLEEARKSLQKFRGDSDIEEELKEMVQGIEGDNKEKFNFKEIFTVKNYRKALLIMVIMDMGQPFSGFEVLLMNLHEILNNSGSEYLSSSTGAIIFAGINLAAATLASTLMDKFGRKVLLIVSSVFACISMAILAAFLNVQYLGYNVTSVEWIPMYSVFIFTAFNKIGIGIVPIVLTAELFATKVKSVCMTLSDGTYLFGVFLATQLFFFAKKTVGMYFAFYFYSGFILFECLFIIFYVPETKGRSMEEIQRILRGEKKSQFELQKISEENSTLP